MLKKTLLDHWVAGVQKSCQWEHHFERSTRDIRACPSIYSIIPFILLGARFAAD